MKQSYEKKIFTKKLAIYLRKKGFRIVGTEVNYKYPQYDVYVFKDTPELRNAMSNFRN